MVQNSYMEAPIKNEKISSKTIAATMQYGALPRMPIFVGLLVFGVVLWLAPVAFMFAFVIDVKTANIGTIIAIVAVFILPVGIMYLVYYSAKNVYKKVDKTLGDVVQVNATCYLEAPTPWQDYRVKHLIVEFVYNDKIVRINSKDFVADKSNLAFPRNELGLAKYAGKTMDIWYSHSCGDVFFPKSKYEV